MPKLKENQFYCVECRAMKTRSKKNTFQRSVPSPKRPNGQALQLVSNCSNCKHQVHKFATERQANKYPQY